MTVDREQIRRDAEGYLVKLKATVPKDELCRRILALLAELEQAERERDAVRKAHNSERSEYFSIAERGRRSIESLQDRLATVSDLVEAASYLYEQVEMDESVGICLSDRVPSLRLGEALAAWESLDAEGAPLRVPPESRRLDRALLNRDEHTR